MTILLCAWRAFDWWSRIPLGHLAEIAVFNVDVELALLDGVRVQQVLDELKHPLARADDICWPSCWIARAAGSSLSSSAEPMMTVSGFFEIVRCDTEELVLLLIQTRELFVGRGELGVGIGHLGEGTFGRLQNDAQGET